MTVQNNLAQLKPTLGSATLVAVTKYASNEQIAAVIDAGQFILGESRVQVAQEKKLLFTDPRIQWHLIGHLQTNKAKQAVQLFEVIQSVDSLRIAEALNAEAEKIGKIQKVLIQINIGKEPQKFGVLPQDIETVFKQIYLLRNLEIEGLMAMAPYVDNPEKVRIYFKEMKIIFDLIKLMIKSPRFTQLSMGMSHDYQVALEEGSTMVRIGSALF